MNSAVYTKGTVTRIIEERQLPNQDQPLYTQQVEVVLDKSDEAITIPVGSEFQPITAAQRLTIGTTVVVTKQTQAGESQYFITEMYRLPILNWLFAGFVVLVLLVGKWRGLASLIGMAFSLLVLIFFPHSTAVGWPRPGNDKSSEFCDYRDINYLLITWF